jgi:transcriptional regulator of acetoin/glycerol metabolism
VGGVGCSVLLSDRGGVVVDRRGAQGDDRTFDSWGLWTGAIWSEQYEGTNGIGTCLVEERAMTIHRDQHFFSRNSLLSCTTVPIFDEHGEIAAALDVSSCRADLTEGFVQLIAVAAADAARHIEAENFRLAFPHARIVLAPSGERTGKSLLAVDHDDLVIGATRAARIALGIDAATLARPMPASDLIGQVDPRHDDFETAERAVVQRALAGRWQCIQSGKGPRDVTRHAAPQDEAVRAAPLTEYRRALSQICDTLPAKQISPPWLAGHINETLSVTPHRGVVSGRIQ